MNKKKSFEQQFKDEKSISSELRIANAYIQNIFRQAPVTIVIYKGDDFVVEVANDAALEMWGKTEQEVSNRPFFEISPELKSIMQPILQRVMQTGEPFIGKEFPAQFMRGGKVYAGFFDFTYQPSYDSNNRIDGIIAVGVDVTASIEARKKIEESAIENSKLAAIVTSSEDAIISKTLEGIITSWNPGAQKLFGYSEKEMLGQSITKLIPPDRLFEENDIITRIQSGKIVDHFQTKRIDKNGNIIDISLTISPIKNSEGKIIGASKIARDITQETKAQEALRYSEEKYRSLFNSIDEGVTTMEIIFDDNGKAVDLLYLDHNPMSEKLTGLKNLEGKRASEALPGGVEPHWMGVIANVAATGVPVRTEYLVEGIGWFSSHLSRLGGPGSRKVIAVYNNISERKFAEQRQAYLLKIENEIRSLNDPIEVQEIINNITLEHFATDRCYFVEIENETAVIYRDSIRGNLPSVAGRYPLDLFPLFRAILEAGKPFSIDDVNTSDAIDEELKLLCLRLQVISFINVPVVKEGVPRGILTLAESKPRKWTQLEKNLAGEIADRIWFAVEKARAEEALQKSEQKYRSLFNGMDEGYCVIEFFDGPHGELSDYVHIEANLAYGINTGIHNIIGQKVREMVPDEADGWVEIYRNVLLTGKPVRFERELVATGRHLELFSFRIEPPELKQVAVLFKDISERKRTEKQLRENEKQLRELSASLEQKVAKRTAQLEEKNIELQKMNKELESFTYISSHDLQEPLRKIQTFAGRIIAKEKDHLSPTAKDYFDRMTDAAIRMQTLLKDLLTFSRVNTAERKFETTHLNLIVEEVKADLKESIAEKNAIIEVGEMHEVKIIPFQFRQLFQNLISNSLKFAKPDTPPHIAIKSEIISVRKLPIFEGKPICHIIYTDNGIGFEPHFSEKIFEVFQKLHGKDEYTGTGIGLAIVKKIVEIHHGQITAKGELGKGAQFDIYLPA